MRHELELRLHLLRRCQGAACVQFGDVAPTPSAPVISGLHPRSGPATGGTVVTLRGSGLAGATAVRVGTVPAPFVVLDDSTVVVRVPPSDPVLVNVWVDTANGTTPNTIASWFQLLPAPDAPPVVLSVLARDGPAAGGQRVEVRGTGLATTQQVRVGPHPATFTVRADSTLEIVTPPGSPGLANVWVTSTAGTTTNRPSSWFRYLAPAPS